MAAAQDNDNDEDGGCLTLTNLSSTTSTTDLLRLPLRGMQALSRFVQCVWICTFVERRASPTKRRQRQRRQRQGQKTTTTTTTTTTTSGNCTLVDLTCQPHEKTPTPKTTATRTEDDDDADDDDNVIQCPLRGITEPGVSRCRSRRRRRQQWEMMVTTKRLRPLPTVAS